MTTPICFGCTVTLHARFRAVNTRKLAHKALLVSLLVLISLLFYLLPYGNLPGQVPAWLAMAQAPLGGVSFSVDLANQVQSTGSGQRIGNRWSSVNSWAYRDSWLWDDERPADYFATHYPFLRSVQLMSATGGCYQGYQGCSTVDRDLYINPADQSTVTDYDFSRLVTAAGNIVKMGLKPWIKTGSVPVKLTGLAVISQAFNVNVRPPDNYDVYYEYIRACAKALVNAFGVDEVRTWNWGVLTEYENSDWYDAGSPGGSQSAYFKLYDYTVAALESVLGAGQVHIGAHSATFQRKAWDELTFIDHVAYGKNLYNGRQGTHIDYLSFSYYEDRAGDPGDFSGNERQLSLVQAVSRLRNRAVADGLTHLLIGIDEGGILYGPDRKSLGRYAMGDSYQGTWDALLFKLMLDNDIAWFSRWDLSSNNIWGGLPYVGTHVATLSYKMATDWRLPIVRSGAPTDLSNIVDAVAGYDPDTAILHVLVFNHNPELFGGQAEKATVSIRNVVALCHCQNTLPAQRWLVDDEHANFWPLWQSDMIERAVPAEHFDYSRYWVEPVIALNNQADRDFFASQATRYADAATLRSEDLAVALDGTTLTIPIDIARHGVAFYEIKGVRPTR